MSSPPSLGTNLDGTAYWTTSFPFLDLMHQASEFIPQSPNAWNTGATLDLDSNGWVTSLPSGVWAGVYPLLHNPAGGETANERYIVMYDGEGAFQGALGTSISEASPGRFVLTSANDGTLGFQITSIEPDDYVRNIRVIREDHLPYFEAGFTFNPEFLERVEDFHTFRFMDWMRTNHIFDASNEVPIWNSSNAASIEWADRPLMTDAQWARGVPVEAMVEICNLTGVDAWFNMPVNASNDYVRQFATYVREHLNAGLEVHIEFSNEVWNWGFPQAHYANAHASGFANHLEWYGVRTAQIGRIWNEVFGESPTGDESLTGRVHVVYNTQAAWLGSEYYGLETTNWYENGAHVRASDYFDEYAVTGYYGFDTSDHNVVRSWWDDADGGFDAAIDSLRRTIDGPLRTTYAYHARQAVERGLELTTYESGYGEVAANETVDYQQFLIEVQRRAELYELETANYENFRAAGGGLYMNFGIISAPSRWGSWSALESLYQDTSPRYDALTDWNATVAPWYETGRDPRVFDSTWMSRIDHLRGSDLADTLIGNGRNNILEGGRGNDILDGQAGLDTALFSGSPDSFQWRENSDGSVTITDLRAGSPEGADVLRNVEVLKFDQGPNFAGETSTTAFDIGDAFFWSAETRTYGAGGALNTILSRTDDGRAFLTDYNIDHADPWNSAVSTYDAQGRLGFVSIYRDMTLVTTYDAAGNQPWNLAVTGYDSQGRRDYVTVVNDDNSQHYTRYFYSGSNDYAIYSYDTNNNLTQTYIHHTDGTYDVIR